MFKNFLLYIPKKILVFLLIITTLFISLPLSSTANYPEKIRVGLFFDYQSKGIKSAVSSFSVSTEKGIQVGYYEGSEINILYKNFNGTPIIIKKDVCFETINNTVNLTDTNAFHIQIGEKYESMADASTKAAELIANGVATYPVYNDGYYVWTGFYKDLNTAKDSIKDISEKAENATLKIILPSETRISVWDSKDKIQFIFDSLNQKLQVLPGVKDQKTFLQLNGDKTKQYRGTLEIRRFKTSDMTVINIIPLEEYLYGVVPYEIGAGSPSEALKAQAVTARTYTLNNLRKYESLDFDVCNTTYSQVYKGVNGETAATNKAVDNTYGEVVMYNNKLASVFYFSSSGGRTEDVQNVWGSSYPYLKSVEDKYEAGTSYNYNWEVKLTKDKIMSILQNKSIDIGDLVSIEATKYSDAGSVIELVITGTKGNKVLKNEQCRNFFTLSSQKFTISTNLSSVILNGTNNVVKESLGGKKVVSNFGISTIDPTTKIVNIIGHNNLKNTVPASPDEYTFTGKGWGHSVGMSQEGAKGMALNKFTYVQIIEHYFTGVKVQKI